MKVPGFGGGGINPLDILDKAQNKALSQQVKMATMTMEFQSNQEAIKAVAEAANAKHEAAMKSLEDIGNAAG